VSKQIYEFTVNDQVRLDPTGNLTTKYQAEGSFSIREQSTSPTKGAKWSFKIDVKDPFSIVQGVIRARNLRDGLKLGVFIYQLNFEEEILDGYGRSAVMFAIRFYIRKMINNYRNR
jgi:hypothetical protein